MENKYSRLQPAFIGLPRLSPRIAQWSSGFLPHVATWPLINMIHASCGISLVLMVVRLVKAEIPNPADYT